MVRSSAWRRTAAAVLLATFAGCNAIVGINEPLDPPSDAEPDGGSDDRRDDPRADAAPDADVNIQPDTSLDGPTQPTSNDRNIAFVDAVDVVDADGEGTSDTSLDGPSRDDGQEGAVIVMDAAQEDARPAMDALSDGPSGDGNFTAADACASPDASGCPCVEGQARSCGDCGDGLQRCVDGGYSPCVGATPKITYYKDGDLDNHGDPGKPLSTCSAPPSGYVASKDDCCDTDPNVWPGQTTYFAPTTACGGWDYNCDQTAELWSSLIVSCYSIGGACYTPYYDGWATAVPSCGGRGDYAYGDDSGCFTLADCNNSIRTYAPTGRLQRDEQQRCR